MRLQWLQKQNFIVAFHDRSDSFVIEDLAILFTHHNTDQPVVHEQSATSLDNHSHTFGISLVARVEEITRNFYVCDICLKQLEMEPIWSEDGGEGEVELAVCEAVVGKLGQWHYLILANRWASLETGDILHAETFSRAF